jgi:signal transduction histidine kinase
VYLDILGHDINSINKEITLTSELLLLRPNLSEQYRRYITTTIDQCKEITDIIKNLQKLSDLFKERQKFTNVDVFKVLAKSLGQIKKEYPKIPLKINQSLVESEVIVRGDARLEDVFVNILDNAIQFDYHDDVELEINHSQSDDGYYWKIEFKDNGPGVPKTFKNKIQRGFELDNDTGRGRGLGLVLIKEIITRYGGKVWIEDRMEGNDKKGSNFIILLPKGFAS